MYNNIKNITLYILILFFIILIFYQLFEKFSKVKLIEDITNLEPTRSAVPTISKPISTIPTISTPISTISMPTRSPTSIINSTAISSPNIQKPIQRLTPITNSTPISSPIQTPGTTDETVQILDIKLKSSLETLNDFLNNNDIFVADNEVIDEYLNMLLKLTELISYRLQGQQIIKFMENINKIK
jgi:hypothetical protein